MATTPPPEPMTDIPEVKADRPTGGSEEK